MFRLILKNIWSRRRRNGWLLAELILVSVISWVVLDPVIVMMHDRSIPMGYDTDRLCLVSLDVLQPKAPGYDSTAVDSASMVSNYYNLVRRAADFEGVEMAVPLLGFYYPGAEGSVSSRIKLAGDSILHDIMFVEFLQHTRFFEAFGFQPGRGMSLQELSNYDFTHDKLVLTENAAEAILPGGDLQDLRFEDSNSKLLYVVATVGTFKYRSDFRPVSIMFRPVLSIDANDIPGGAHILIRVKDDVSMKRFLHDFRPWAVKELKRGNLFVRTVSSYDEIIAGQERDGNISVYRRNVAMAAFFLINLCLGVIGTFWLQTRMRREEVGVMLSFGATPSRIVRMLMGEGAVLTLAASLVGFLIYLQYALKEGLVAGFSGGLQYTEQYWVSSFASHFIGVSAIIFLILLVVVLLGIYIPAKNISRIPPAEALRDE